MPVFEFLNEATVEMFTKTNLTHQQIDIAMIYYEKVLTKPKFKSQRWLFQKYLYEWSAAFAYGYFKNNVKALGPSAAESHAVFRALYDQKL